MGSAERNRRGRGFLAALGMCAAWLVGASVLAQDRPWLDGQVPPKMLDRETRCGIGRLPRCDVETAIERGLFETGLTPVFPADLSCRNIDEGWAIDYGHKRDRQTYHGGIDMPAPFGEPIIAAAAGTVIATYDGQSSMRGREIVLRHSPEDTGLGVWTYTQYAHLDARPAIEVGARVKMGEVLGPTGNSGTTPRQTKGARRPAIHFAAWFSADPGFVAFPQMVIPVGGYWMDPNALYRMGPPFDSRSLRALPAGEKKVPVAVMTRDGTVVPSGAKLVWPYFCDRM